MQGRKEKMRLYLGMRNWCVCLLSLFFLFPRTGDSKVDVSNHFIGHRLANFSVTFNKEYKFVYFAKKHVLKKRKIRRLKGVEVSPPHIDQYYSARISFYNQFAANYKEPYFVNNLSFCSLKRGPPLKA